MTTTIEAWQESRLDCLEAEVDAIKEAAIALERLDGMFDTRNVISIVQACKDELNMQVTNKKKQLDMARGAKSKAKASVA